MGQKDGRTGEVTMNYDLKIQLTGTHKATTTGIKAVHFALVVSNEMSVKKLRELNEQN